MAHNAFAGWFPLQLFSPDSQLEYGREWDKEKVEREEERRADGNGIHSTFLLSPATTHVCLDKSTWAIYFYMVYGNCGTDTCNETILF